MMNTLTTKAYVMATESLRSGLQRFKQDQRGVTAIEYGLIAVAVAALIVAVFYNENGFLAKLSSRFSDLTSLVGKVSMKYKEG